MTSQGALVIFVKTPGLSPIKTRLARATDEAFAEEFYLRSINATAAYVQELKKSEPHLSIYWAVAEDNGIDSSLWSKFSVICQGDGDLGARLSKIYSTLIERHDFVCFIGADSPHLPLEKLRAGVLETERMLRRKFVLGETSDGGFYFFGGSISVPNSVWTSVEYSASSTAQELRLRLQSIGEVGRIEKDFDIDTVEDLRRYSEILVDKLLPEQVELIDWAKSRLVTYDGVQLPGGSSQ